MVRVNFISYIPVPWLSSSLPAARYLVGLDVEPLFSFYLFSAASIGVPALVCVFLQLRYYSSADPAALCHFPSYHLSFADLRLWHLWHNG